MSRQTPAVKAFDTAYPGSMVERLDGYYICRNDHASMAAALVELIASRDREIEDLRSARKQCLDYAVNLASILRRKHFPLHSEVEWLPDTLGVLTQIDNMVSAWEGRQ